MTASNTKRFVIVVASAALIASAVLLVVSPGLEQSYVSAAVFFGLVGVVAVSLTYKLAHGASGSIAHLPFLSALLVAPGFTTVLAIAAAILVGELLAGRERLKLVFNVSQHAFASSLAALMFIGLGGQPLDWQDLRSSLIPFTVSFATLLAANSCLVSGVVAVSQRRRFSAVWQQNTLNTIVYDFFSFPAVFFFAFVYVRFGLIWAVGLAVPLLGLRQLYKTNWQLEKVNEELLQLMVAAIEARDPYTSGHSQRVAEYSRIVSRAAGFNTRATDRIYTAALLHDVGKIHEEFAPILRNPGRLTEAEYAVMKTHCEKGATLVGKVSQFHDLIPAILGHHEAWDGSGYPRGLAGESIPIWARVISLADTIDAMTTDRPYRKALSAAEVRDEIRTFSGRQFDPRLARELSSDKFWQLMELAICAHTEDLPAIGPTARAAPRLPRQKPVATEILSFNSAKT